MALVLSIIATYFICKILNRNTVGTLGAYAKRAFVVWVVCFFILLGLLGG